MVKIKRYIRNIRTLSHEENSSLSEKSVAVIGSGGLGGYVIEMLGRIGVGNITVVDGDVFDETNLNRQILSDSQSLGKQKPLIAKERMQFVNPLIKIRAITENLSEDNYQEILPGHQVIVDCLDSIETRLLLNKFCQKLNIPMVHGAIAGWYGQVSTIFPEDKTFDKIYASQAKKGHETELGNPSFTPALVASIQVSEVIKILINRGDLLRHQVLFIDLLSHEYERIYY